MSDLQRTFDEISAQVSGLIGAASPESRRQRRRERERRRQAMARIARRLVLATVAILVAGLGWGLFVAPLGIMGVLVVVVAMVLAWVAIVSLSSTPAPTPQALAASDLPLLPQRTEEWLACQRPALPAPAVRLTDGIALQLETIAPQLAALDPQAPAALHFRKLVAEDLPELIDGWRRVPEPLRRSPRDGMAAPDKQLLDGLGIVRDELGRLGGEIARGDLDRLATQNRYLELKYKGAADADG
ncbi:MAG: hypothetical protein PGN09_02005 [Sphingomonas fennica]